MRTCRDGISARQLGALALTAAGLPVFRLCCRISWVWVLPGGAAAAALLSALTTLLNRRAALPRPGGAQGAPGACCPVQGYAILLAPLLLAAALSAAWESSFAFPETASSWLAAAFVLLPAAAAAWLGPASPGRCAGILLWVTGALYGTVLIFSLPQLRPERLLPGGGPEDAVRVFAALLSPGAALCLRPGPGEDRRLPHWPWWGAFALALAASVVTGGILSPPLAREPEAFRTLARGVSVLGVIRRFEALVNGAQLMSGFSLCALFLTAFRVVLENWKPLKKIF